MPIWKESKLLDIEKNQKSEYWKQWIGRERRTSRKETAIKMMKNADKMPDWRRNTFYSSVRNNSVTGPNHLRRGSREPGTISIR